MTDFISEFIQKKRLGQILVDKHLITEDQLMECLQAQAETKEFIGELLVRKGFIDEEVLYQTLAEQLKIRYHSLEEAKKRLEQESIPEDQSGLTSIFAKQNKIFVLDATGNEIEILTSDPLNLTLRDQIEMITHRTVNYSVCSRSTASQLLSATTQKTRDVGKRLIEEAFRSPLYVVTKLCDECGEEMIFVLAEIAKKHPDSLARRVAIKRMGNFHNSTLVFIFQQLAKNEPNHENREIIDAMLKHYMKGSGG
ncbi:MAG: hypothetical protein PHW04_12765 [Candidatus Wallbacteria bacterium]|nr:hypothetical protein [Candidatus Wallbacteria bacterium]